MPFAYTNVVKILPRMGHQGPEARVRVAHSLEWWTCAQVTRVQSMSADYFFFLYCVSIYDFIFKMVDFTNFRFEFHQKS